ncbi:MAG: FAD-dependent oxidoreductase [Gammaproteobacteria bacterium]|nr:FAD-dependent oxidoreductase [Gammaproteobacteria bacterium]
MNDSKDASLHVVVVGAGIVGVATAEWLRRDGHKVTLVDERPPGEGTSYGNAGILARGAVIPVPTPGILTKAPGMLLRKDGPLFLRWGYLPRLLPWLIQYLRSARRDRVETIASALAHLLTDTVDQHLALARGTPAERWICTDDYLYLYRSQADFDRDAFGWQLRGAHGVTIEPMQRAALEDLDPHLGPRYQFAVRMQQHGHIKDPGRYVKDLSDWFTAQGGHFLQHRVEDIRPAESGVQIVCQGTTLDADRVVLASGVWTGELAKKIGHKTGIEAERGYHVEFVDAAPMPVLPYMLADRKLVLTPMDGRLRAAGLVEFGGVDAAPDKAPIRLLKAAARDTYPSLTFSECLEWMGSRPSTSDSLPLLGASPAHKTVYFACGHQHIGLTAGPKSGRIIADLIAGRTSNRDLSAFAVDRFD